MNEFAKTQIDRLANLLNSQVAGVFVFSGPASNKPPIADPDAIRTNFASNVNTVVDAVTNTAATIQAMQTLNSMIKMAHLQIITPFLQMPDLRTSVFFMLIMV